MKQSKNTSPKLVLLTAALALLLPTLLPKDASALDGYADRRGLFGGLTIGGGVGLVDVDPKEECCNTGLDQGRKLGINLGAQLGGGVSKDLVFLGEANWWGRTVEVNDRALEHHHLSFNGLFEYFLFDALFLEAGGGLAYGIFDVSNNSQLVERYQEMGLALKAGAGFEFFVNGQVAIGMRFGYTRHFYTNGSFDVVNGGLSLRWY
jgi:hypothetical protein